MVSYSQWLVGFRVHWLLVKQASTNTSTPVSQLASTPVHWCGWLGEASEPATVPVSGELATGEVVSEVRVASTPHHLVHQW